MRHKQDINETNETFRQYDKKGQQRARRVILVTIPMKNLHAK